MNTIKLVSRVLPSRPPLHEGMRTYPRTSELPQRKFLFDQETVSRVRARRTNRLNCSSNTGFVARSFTVVFSVDSVSACKMEAPHTRARPLSATWNIPDYCKRTYYHKKNLVMQKGSCSELFHPIWSWQNHHQRWVVIQH